MASALARSRPLLTACGLVAGMMAVDLCAGDGWFTLPMARMARHVAAIDIDPTLLTLARHRVGLSNWQLVKADAYDLPKAVCEPGDFVANVFHGVP